MLGATVTGPEEWAAFVLRNADAVVNECSARSLQTNEPLRCAALLPALSRIDGPIALLELGASGGLCLYPDRYAYRYRSEGRLVAEVGESAVLLETEVRGGALPELALPQIVWRAGIDLQPLDARAWCGPRSASGRRASRRPWMSSPKSRRCSSPAMPPMSRSCVPSPPRRRGARHSS